MLLFLNSLTRGRLIMDILDVKYKYYDDNWWDVIILKGVGKIRVRIETERKRRKFGKFLNVSLNKKKKKTLALRLHSTETIFFPPSLFIYLYIYHIKKKKD